MATRGFSLDRSIDPLCTAQQLLHEQDASLDGLSKSVTSLNAVAVEISHEIKSQNKCVRPTRPVNGLVQC